MLSETQAETAADLQVYLSMAFGEVLAQKLSKKQAEILESQLRTLIRRGAEQMARDILKLPKNKREEYIQRIASQSS